MSKWLCVLLLACAGAHAAPGAPAEDDMGQFMAEKGLMQRLDEVRHNVTDRASDLVVTAMGFLGVLYKRGGNSVETGFDCSGLIRHVYQTSAGIQPPRTVALLRDWGESLTSEALRSGDLVVFFQNDVATHAGIYVGEGRFVHAPNHGGRVRLDHLDDRYWKQRFRGARRVLG